VSFVNAAAKLYMELLGFLHAMTRDRLAYVVQYEDPLPSSI
jgi:hypothetical protein